MKSKIINRINIKKPLDETEGFEIHDYLREGRQYELSPRKLSVFLKIIFRKINELIDAVNKLNREKTD